MKPLAMREPPFRRTLVEPFAGMRIAVAAGVVALAAVAGCSPSRAPQHTSPPSTVAPPTTTTAPPVVPKGHLPSDPGEVPTGDPSAVAYAPAGGLVADLGFRPPSHGLPFENYGNRLPDGSVPTDLTAEEVRSLFGPAVCVDPAAAVCELVPPADAWRADVNKQMAGGHCFGLAVAALLLWRGTLHAPAYGATSIGQLAIRGNPLLQRTLAYYWSLQLLDAVRLAGVYGDPNTVLARLRDALQPNPVELYTINFYKRGFLAGHAVTPYAVEDAGGSRFNVLVYDNNWPGVSREITFDTNANTWEYLAANNPDRAEERYAGDAGSQTIMLLPVGPGLTTQPCPFCMTRAEATATERNVGAGKRPPMSEVYLDGDSTVDHADLLLTSVDGKRTGYVGGNLVNEIPGAEIEAMVANEDWNENIEPHLLVPAGRPYTITIDGHRLHAQRAETIGIVGPGYDVSIEGAMRPDDHDTISLASEATAVRYQSSRPKTVTLQLGTVDRGGDYAVALAGVRLGAHGAVRLTLPVDGRDLTITTDRSALPTRADLSVRRERRSGDATFRVQGVRLPGGSATTFHIAAWPGALAALSYTTTVGGHRASGTLSNQPAA